MPLANPHLDAFAKTWEDSFFRPSQNTSFLIPKYQRKYSWKDVQVEEFWQDLNTSDNLFIGTVMLRKTTSGQFEIIDGQQRFLNITMICALIRDKLFGIGTADSKQQARTIQTDAIARRVMAPTGTTEHYFLEPGQSLRTLFKNHIQSFEGQSLLEVEISAIGSTKEERLIKEQYQSLNDKIDETIVNDMGQEAKQDKLFKLWMKICQLRIIYVEIENEVQAYEIFESVNDKGLNLNVGDLVKNKIFGSLHGRESSHEDLWDELITNLEESQISTKDFLKYFWWSRYGYVSAVKLYKEIKNKFHTPDEWKDFFISLVEASNDIKVLMKGNIESLSNYETNHRHYKSLHKNLLALRSFPVKTWLVIMLCIFRNRQSLPKMAKFYKRLEMTTFLYFLYGEKSNYYHQKMYSYSKKIQDKIKEGDVTDSDWNELFQALIRDIKSKIPTNEELHKDIFIEKFSQIKYTNGSDYVKYVLMEMQKDEAPPALWDNNVIEIEHIFPQTPSVEWNVNKKDAQPFVHLIGNLSLITSQANSAINNDSYSTKVLTYADEASSFPQMKDLVDNCNLPDSNPAKWKFDKIKKDDYSCVTKRAKALSDKAWDVWINAIANF